MGKSTTKRGEALVAIMRDPTDWRRVQEQLWYRIPVESAPRRWPPQWLAFYQTKIFKDEAYSIRWYGKVRMIHRVPRSELFPDEFPNAKSDKLYYQIFLHRLDALPTPIISHRLRLIVFIPTTYHKLLTAEEINDLWDDSPLEDALWEQLKRLHLNAERQYDIKIAAAKYKLDFALFCSQGNINLETDGDYWHINTERAPEDNRRNNALATQGWQVMRFTTAQIREEMETYCVPRIAEAVNKMGGLDDNQEPPRTYLKGDEGIVQQLALFDNRTAYTAASDEEAE